MKVRHEVFIGAAGILLSIFVWWATSLFPVFNVQGLGAAFFPRFLAILLVIFSIVLILSSKAVKKDDQSDKNHVSDTQATCRLSLVMAGSILYYIAMVWIGYIIPSLAYIIFLAMLHQQKKRVLPALGESIALVAIVYVVFVIVLQTPLPQGRLF